MGLLTQIRNTLGAAAPSSQWLGQVRAGRATGADGTGIYYEVVGEGETTMLLANGLGGRLYAWQHLIDALWQRVRFITWDYRGLFESEAPRNKRRLAVVHHADDAEAILRAEGVQRAVLCGWSMGVQVSLQLAANEPDLVAGMVLINGTYGHAFTTGFQPVFSIPFLPKRLHSVVEWIQAHPETRDLLAYTARSTEVGVALAAAVTAGPKVLQHRRFIRQYFDDVLGPSFGNYLTLFQELDAHSAYHLLPSLRMPALVVSGALDPLTPAYQSREIARRLPNAEHLRLLRAGHFALMERPEVVVPAITRFLEQRAR